MSHLLHSLRRREFSGAGSFMTSLNDRLYWKINLSNSSGKACEGCVGAVFNVEFSPRGHVLLAACEHNALQVYDPQTHQCVRTVLGAHNDCVNCIKFLDDRLFATCSDDKSVRVWDLRNLYRPVMTFRKHGSWVKSVEFASNEKLLVTASFDNTVRLWDINRSADDPSQGEMVVQHDLITRVKLSPDNTKLCLASHGLLLVVHNLHLPSLKKEFREQEFIRGLGLQSRPDTVGLKNSIETIDTWPDISAPPFVISSLQVFPDSNKLLSRYTTLDEETEWLCVHSLWTVALFDNDTSHRSDSSDTSSSASVSSDEDDIAGKVIHHSCLLAFSKEANVQADIIKEAGISCDGKIICSPYGNGLRLLCLDDDRLEPSEFCEKPKPLQEVRLLLNRKTPLLTARFSPTQMLVASGSMDGSVLFYQPQLG